MSSMYYLLYRRVSKNANLVLVQRLGVGKEYTNLVKVQSIDIRNDRFRGGTEIKAL